MSNNNQILIDELEAKLEIEKQATISAFKEKLKRQEIITEKLKSIIEEKSDNLKIEMLNSLAPWIIENIALLEDEHKSSLSKLLAKKKSASGKSAESSRRSYYLVDGNALAEESKHFYNELLSDDEVVKLEEDENFIVVYSKNYAGKVKVAADAIGTKSGELYRKHATGIKTLEAGQNIDIAKLLKIEFKPFTYKEPKK